jgi:hypothetical protein
LIFNAEEIVVQFPDERGFLLHFSYLDRSQEVDKAEVKEIDFLGMGTD